MDHPLGWRSAQLGGLVDFRNGKSVKPGGAGAYPVYGSNGIIGATDKCMYSNAIILGRVGAYCGSVEYCKGPFWASDNTIVVEPLCDRLDVVFAYYLLQHAALNCHAGGAAQPLLTQTRLRPLEFAIPGLDQQKRIASILSAYDDLIENNMRRIAILEEMARRIFEEWFVHFRAPGCEGLPHIDSPLGPIPQGWEAGSLGDVLDLKFGKALKADDRRAGPYPVYGSSGIVGAHDTALVEGPGIIVGRKGNVGSVHWSERSFYPIDTVFFVSTDLPLVYIYHLLKKQRFLNSDAAVPGLNLAQALATQFALPPSDLCARFADYAEPLFGLVHNLSSQNSNLRTQRDLVLPKLISGEIDVSTAPAALTEEAE